MEAQRTKDVSNVGAENGTVDLAPKDGFRCMTLAMELPLVAGITDTLAATTQLITSSRPVCLVTESIRNVGDREDVKSVISSVNVVYENNVGPRVESLKTSLNPTLQSLDDMACTGITKVNNKVTETREAYVDPVVNKVTDIKDGTRKVYDNCVDKVSHTKEAYVDPVVNKAIIMKDSTTKAYSDCVDMVSSARENYVDPTLNRVGQVRDNYVAPAMTLVKDAAGNPGKAYSDAVSYGKGVVSATKDATINKAVETVDSAKGYLIAAKDNTVDQIQVYLAGASDSVKKSGKVTLDRAITYARQSRTLALERTQRVLVSAQAVILAGISERFPTAAVILEKGLNRLVDTTKAVAVTTKNTAVAAVRTTRFLIIKAGDGYEWSKDKYGFTRDTLSSTLETAVVYGKEFTLSQEENIRYVASLVGFTAYLGMIGIAKEKTQ